jgi:hypothetical protein
MKLTGSRFQCILCGQHFAGPHSFTRHRHPIGAHLACLSADEMRSRGLSLNAAGFWTLPHPARPDDATPAHRGTWLTSTRSAGAS